MIETILNYHKGLRDTLLAESARLEAENRKDEAKMCLIHSQAHSGAVKHIEALQLANQSKKFSLDVTIGQEDTWYLNDEPIDKSGVLAMLESAGYRAEFHK